jgi:hypothetical protein
VGFQRNNAAAQRAAERREREDAAPRLTALIPTLTTLALQFEERRTLAGGETGPSDAAPHIRRVVVEHAPALFNVPCGNRGCQGGGHDLTREILAELRSAERTGDGEATFGGNDSCSGYDAAGNRCELSLRYRATATFTPPHS